MNQQLSQAIQLLKSGQAQESQKILTTLCQQQPDNGDAYNALGFSYLALEEKDKALSAFKKVTEIAPKASVAWENLAGVYYEMNELELAKVNFKKAVELDENHYQAWHFLSLIHYRLNEFPLALQSQNNAEQSDPFLSQINQAQSATNTGDMKVAASLCQQILNQHRRHPRALYVLAMLSVQQGKLENAVNDAKLGLSFAPYDYKLRNFLCQLYSQLRSYKQAVDESSILVKQVPSEASYWLLHADNLLNAGRYKDALFAYDGLKQHVNDAEPTYLQQGDIYKALGNKELCIESYRNCLNNIEQVGSAYWALVNLSGSGIDEDDISKLEELQLDPDISTEQACQASFALAKCYEQLGRYELAFSTYQSANLNRSGGSFIPEQYLKKCDAIISSFNKSVMALKAPVNESSVTPIFIVGLPRSGSTLIEQILASHSMVEGTMELKTIPAIARQMFLESVRKNQNSSGSLDAFTDEELAYYGEKYLKDTEIYRTNKPYFIDKLPPNFQHIGLIKKILPSAIIIDARRQPLACGFGIYKQYFGKGHDFSYNLEHIAFYYQQYLRLMAHWSDVLPGEIFHCQYEEMVSNTESQVKELLAFCKLPFEAGCLAFHENKRAVRTASSDQVRRPINKEGVDMWKNYSAQLSPLKEALGKDVLGDYQSYID